MIVRCRACNQMHDPMHRCPSKIIPLKSSFTPVSTQSVTTQPDVTTDVTTASDRVRAWRAAHRERYNEYMRQWRARQKPNRS